MSYISHIIKETKENSNFRKVIFTGKKSQLVVMAIPPLGEVGEEIHYHVEQTLFVLNGTGVAILDGEKTAVAGGDAVIVTPGTKHNIVNTGHETLKIYTLYAPANHIDGRVHTTKVDADDDVEDEAFGEAVK